jgi:ribosomal protein S18 acetylase RimI-like enzyme
MYSHHIMRALADAHPAIPHRRLHDGTTLAVRPIAPADKGALAAFFAALTPESRNSRFLGPKPRLSPRELAYFTEIDHRRHVALVAHDDAGRFVGLGQYAGWAADPRAGELAIAIADDYQRQGLGTSLALDLIERARANELARLTATTQSRNRAGQRLLRRVGFQVTGRADGLVELELAL